VNAMISSGDIWQICWLFVQNFTETLCSAEKRFSKYHRRIKSTRKTWRQWRGVCHWRTF